MSFRNFKVPYQADPRYAKRVAYFSMEIALDPTMPTYKLTTPSGVPAKLTSGMGEVFEFIEVRNQEALFVCALDGG